MAAVIIEPVAGNMGLVLPEKRFLQGLRELTTKYGALLIFDEVISGFRLGKGGAQEYFSITPDLTTMGKVIGGELPVGAYGGRKEIMEKLSLPCSIGIGSNKTIAKIGSDCMKPQGLTYIIPEMEKEFLAPMPVETIPGVGKVTLKNLHSKGIYRICDITSLPQDYFAAAYGKYGIDLYKKANGGGSEYLTLDREQKSISHERTFKDVTSKQYLKEKLFKLTGKACQELRDKGWEASTINIKLRYSDFKTLTRSKTIKPTDDDKTVFDVAWKMMMKAYTRRVAVRLIGVGLSRFNKFSEQEELFEWEEIKRRKRRSRK